ncbi:MAG: flagellar hook-length control protein FliK [Acidimicrobiales bacterium]
MQTSGAPDRPASGAQLPGVASQIVSVLAPLRATPAGTQSVTIALHPADLGTVQATLVLRDGTLTVRLVASTSAGTAALHAALPDLQSGLTANGERSSVLLGDPGSQGGSQPQGHPGGSSSHASPASAGAQSPASLVASPGPPGVSGHLSTTHRLLDVRA